MTSDLFYLVSNVLVSLCALVPIGSIFMQRISDDADADGMNERLDWQQNRQINALLIIVAAMLLFYRRSQSKIQFLPLAFVAAKGGAIVALYFWEPKWIIPYLIVVLVTGSMFPTPTYKGSSNIEAFNEDSLEQMLEEQKKKFEEKQRHENNAKYEPQANPAWIIEFYAIWSPPCVQFSGSYAEISVEYANEHLKFGRIDVQENPGVLSKFGISTNQLPSFLVFKNGKEISRFPVAQNGVAGKWKLTKESFIKAISLDKLAKRQKGN